MDFFKMLTFLGSFDSLLRIFVYLISWREGSRWLGQILRVSDDIGERESSSVYVVKKDLLFVFARAGLPYSTCTSSSCPIQLGFSTGIV
jgi:hypothetical protein